MFDPMHIFLCDFIVLATVPIAVGPTKSREPHVQCTLLTRCRTFSGYEGYSALLPTPPRIALSEPSY